MDPNNPTPVQGTPVSPEINADIGNIQEMDINAIVPAYDSIGNKFNEMGQNIIKDVAGRQQQLIGNNFSTPGEGMMGDYNENTYIKPAVTSSQSAIKQMGTQVALSEGMRRGQEAAEQKLKDTQNKYNEWVAEQNRKAAAAAAARQQQQQQQMAAQNQKRAGVNSIDSKFLKDRGLTQDDFAAMSSAEQGKLLATYYDKVGGIDWSDKKTWDNTAEQTLKKFGIPKSQWGEYLQKGSAKNKEFWSRKDVGDSFTAGYLNKYGNGAQILKAKTNFVTETKAAVQKWLNPTTKEEAAKSFDEVFRAVDMKILTKTTSEEKSLKETPVSLLRRFDEYNKGSSKKNLTDDEKAELAKGMSNLKANKDASKERLSELLNKATGATSAVPNMVGSIDSTGRLTTSTPAYTAESKLISKYKLESTNAAEVLEGLYGLDNKELIALKKFKEEDHSGFKRVSDIVAKVQGGTFVSISDGRDIPDNYYVDDKTKQLTLAAPGQYIIHSVAGGHEDEDLKKLRTMLDDGNFMEAVSVAQNGGGTEEDKKKAEQFYKVSQQYMTNQSAALILGDTYGVDTGSSLYNAAAYKANGDRDTGKLKIQGKPIKDWVNELRSMSRDDHGKANDMYRDLMTLASSERGSFVDKYGEKVDMKDQYGDNTISAKGKYFQGMSAEEAAAVLTVWQKEIAAGNIDTNFMGAGAGTGWGIPDKAKDSLQTTLNIGLMLTGFLTGGYFDDNQDTFAGKLYYGNADLLINNKKGEWAYESYRDRENYDLFKTLAEAQNTANDEWLGAHTDIGVTAKHTVADMSQFGFDLIIGLGVGGASKAVATKAAKGITTKLVSSAAKNISTNLEKVAVRNAAKKGIEYEGTFVLKGVDGAVQKKTISEVSKDLARIASSGGDSVKYLQSIEGGMFKGVGEKRLNGMIEEAFKKYPLAKRASVDRAIRQTLKQINRDTAGITALSLAKVPMKSIEKASAPALKAAVELVGEIGDEPIESALRASAKGSAGKTAKEGAEASAKNLVKGASPRTGNELARMLINESAKRAMTGKSMTKYDVLKFLARNGDDSARKRVVMQRFWEGELIGNTLFLVDTARRSQDPNSDYNRLTDSNYMISSLAFGTVFSVGMMGVGGGLRSIKIDKLEGAMAKAQEAVVRNSQDVTSPEYIKASEKLAKLTMKADRLYDSAMRNAYDSTKVARFKKTSEEAKLAIKEQLDHIQKQFGEEDFGTSVAAKKMADALSIKQGFGRRYAIAMGAAKSEAMLRWRQYATDMPMLAKLDAQSSARLTARAYEAGRALGKDATPEEVKEAMAEAIATGMGKERYKDAKREALYLLDEYDSAWKDIEKGSAEGYIDINTFGGKRRKVYLSPAGITHTMDDDVSRPLMGLIGERKVNRDVASPVVEREVDHGALARAWAEGKKIDSGNGMKVRNPDGFNLVTSLQTYKNRITAETYLSSIDRNIIKNGDVVISGEANMAKAIQADKNYYEDLLTSIKNKRKEVLAKVKSAPKRAKATKEMKELESTIAKLEESIKNPTGTGIGMDKESISIASKIAGVTDEQFVSSYKKVANMLKKNKEDILKGKEPHPGLKNIVTESGDYTDEAILDITLRALNPEPYKRLAAREALESSSPSATSAYLKGLEPEDLSTIVYRLGGNRKRTRELLNEARRHFAHAEDTIGIGDIAKYVAERMPLKDGNNALDYRPLYYSLGRVGEDEKILQEAANWIVANVGEHGAKGEADRDSALRLILAISEKRDPGSNLRVDMDKMSEEVVDSGVKRLVDDGSKSNAIEVFSSLNLEEQTSAIKYLDEALRAISPTAKNVAEKQSTTASGLPIPKTVEAKPIAEGRQFNLLDIVAAVNKKEGYGTAENMAKILKDTGRKMKMNGKNVPESKLGGSSMKDITAKYEPQIDEAYKKLAKYQASLSNAYKDKDRGNEVEGLAGMVEAANKQANLVKELEKNYIKELDDSLLSFAGAPGVSAMKSQAPHIGVPMEETIRGIAKKIDRGNDSYFANWLDDIAEKIEARKGLEGVQGPEDKDMGKMFTNYGDEMTELERLLDADSRRKRPLISSFDRERLSSMISTFKNTGDSAIEEDPLDGIISGLMRELDDDALKATGKKFKEGEALGSNMRPIVEAEYAGAPKLPIAQYYEEIGSKGYPTVAERVNQSKKELRKAKRTLEKLRDKQDSDYAAAVEAHKTMTKPDKANLRNLDSRLRKTETQLKNVVDAVGGGAYINRNGLHFISEPNGLSGYTNATTITLAGTSDVGVEGFHPIKNASIRRQNRKAGTVNKGSVKARELNLKELLGRVDSASGMAEGKSAKYGAKYAAEDMLVQESLAAIKSVEQRQFSSNQSMQMALLKVSGFSKAIQNMQLAAGYSVYNAYSFRFMLSAMMQNPGQGMAMLKAFSDAKSMKSVADFWGHNQDLFTEVTMVTGDSMYLDAFADANAVLADESTGYIGRLKKSFDDSEYREVSKKNTKEERQLVAAEQGYDSYKNAPQHDSRTVEAVKAGKAMRTKETVRRAVEETWDVPTFQRFIPVLQATMFVKNYNLALKRAQKVVNARFKAGEIASPVMTKRDLDNAMMMAHVRTKLFFSPASTSKTARQFLLKSGSGSVYDEMALRNFLDKLDKEQIDIINKGNQGQNLGKIMSSLFFALQYKSTQIGQLLNGISGLGKPKSFVLAGGKNQVATMTAMIVAAAIFNEINGREVAFDDPEKMLLNLNNMGKFRLGDGEGSPAVDPFFSQFTLVNSLTRSFAGLMGVEGGSASGNVNPHRTMSLGRLDAVSDEIVANLLSPYKAMAEVLTNNTYFGNNIWEKSTLRDGTPNPNYNPLRNIGASVSHILGLDSFQSNNAWVKGENTIGDKTGRTGGSGFIQHPYIDAITAFNEGDYGKAMFGALEMPIKWDNLSGAARSSLNGYVIKSMAGYKDTYDKEVKKANGSKEAIDKAYENYVRQSIQTINDWSEKHSNALEKNPKLISAAQKIITGFLANEYDDNLMKMQYAFWRAKIDSQMGDDFGWDMKPDESEEDFDKRKAETSKAYNAQLDAEYEAREELKKHGYKLTTEFDYDDMMSEYRNSHRNVLAQVRAQLSGKVNGFKSLEESKKNYEAKISAIDDIYTSRKKAQQKKSELAREHNEYVLDIIAPYVDKYGSGVLDYYDRGEKEGMANMVSELLIIPADEMRKYGLNRSPQKNMLKDIFGVGYKNNSNLPSDTEFYQKFNKVLRNIEQGKTASASTSLDRIIKEVGRGSYGVSGSDWARVVRYREIINGRLGL